MKRSLCAILLFAAVPSFANQYRSHRIFSTDAVFAKIPRNLNFHSETSDIVNKDLFDQIFEFPACEREISGRKNPALALSAAGDHGLSFSVNGSPQTPFQHGRADYIPEHYSNGVKVPDHYRVELFDKTILHIAIRDAWLFDKTLRISKVEVRGGEIRLIPILEATSL